MGRLTELHQKVLFALDGSSFDGEPGYLNFRGIAREGGIEQQFVRRAVRHLARKGFAEYGRGLWTEDGTPAGAGYRITPAGRAALADTDQGARDA